MASEKRLIDADDCGRYIASCLGFGNASVEDILQYMAEYTEQNEVNAVEVVLDRVGDVIFEVDPEHGVVEHKIYEVCVVYKTTATDDSGTEWDDFYTSDDIGTAYKTRQDAEADFCAYGERKDNEETD